jgi:hypothetical protein
MNAEEVDVNQYVLNNLRPKFLITELFSITIPKQSNKEKANKSGMKFTGCLFQPRESDDKLYNVRFSFLSRHYLAMRSVSHTLTANITLSCKLT